MNRLDTIAVLAPVIFVGREKRLVSPKRGYMPQYSNGNWKLEEKIICRADRLSSIACDVFVSSVGPPRVPRASTAVRYYGKLGKGTLAKFLILYTHEQESGHSGGFSPKILSRKKRYYHRALLFVGLGCKIETRTIHKHEARRFERPISCCSTAATGVTTAQKSTLPIKQQSEPTKCHLRVSII